VLAAQPTSASIAGNNKHHAALISGRFMSVRSRKQKSVWPGTQMSARPERKCPRATASSVRQGSASEDRNPSHRRSCSVLATRSPMLSLGHREL
jgi:hypothetical protein